jgi:acyl-coenzyme A thioesterase PaaI-like protein
VHGVAILEVPQLSDDPAGNAVATKDALTIPLHGRMGLNIVRRADPTVVSMELTDEVRGAFAGAVHGGMLATLADVTCALATSGHYEVVAEARLVHGGRRALTSECAIVDGEKARTENREPRAGAGDGDVHDRLSGFDLRRADG